MKRFLISLAAILLTFSLSQEARSQWQNGNLALKTNGNLFQSGDQLKVEVLALEAITEPFSMQVSYKFMETVQEKDKDGNVSTKEVERTRTRERSPVIESLPQFNALVLDDTFNFGEGSPAGRYAVEVTVFRGESKERVATLRCCVFYKEQDQHRACATYLRSLKRVVSDVWFIFDGNFAERSRYSAVFLRGGKVSKYIMVGASPSGPHELNISSEALAGMTGQTYEILVHDHLSNTSSTLARVIIPSPY